MELTNPQAVLSIHPLDPHLERRPSDTQELPVHVIDRNISDMIISAASSEELPQMTRRRTKRPAKRRKRNALIEIQVVSSQLEYHDASIDIPLAAYANRKFLTYDHRVSGKIRSGRNADQIDHGVNNLFFLHDCEADGVYEFFTLVETVISVESVYERKSEKFGNR